MKTELLLFLVVIVADVAPTSQDLHARYGPSDVERFHVRPDIDATVQYGSDGCLCQVVLGAPTSIADSTLRAAYVPTDEMQTMTDEMAPPQSRGALINSGTFQASCGVGSWSDYENVAIGRGWTACPPSPGRADTETRIRFKRKECPLVRSESVPASDQKP